MDFDYGIEAILTDLSLVSSTNATGRKKSLLRNGMAVISGGYRNGAHHSTQVIC